MFVCDASAEAERLMVALRNRGYPALDVPLGLLPTRLRYEIPELILLDIDAHEAPQRLEEMGEVLPASVRLILIGYPRGELTQDSPWQKRASLVLTRPLDIPETVEKLQELLGPPAQSPVRAHPRHSPRAPILVPSARRPYRAEPSLPPPSATEAFQSFRPSVAPRAHPFIADTLSPHQDTASLIPSSSHLSVPPDLHLPQLSSETLALLEQAKRRVHTHSSSSPPLEPLNVDYRPSPEISPEHLAVLLEPVESQETTPRASSAPALPTPARPDAAPVAQALEAPPASDPTVALPPASAPHASSLAEEDRTNPGGRPPSRTPRGRESAPPASLSLTSPGSRLPALDDLSDLLAPPSSVSSEFQEEPATSRGGKQLLPLLDMPVELDEPASSRGYTREHHSAPDSEEPSTSPGGKQKTQLSSAPPEGTSLSPSARSHSPIATIAACIRERKSGTWAQAHEQGIRRVLFRDGDFLTITSSAETESLVQFLAERGALRADLARSLTAIPKMGRHAGAALIAQGHLRQEDLWPVLRAHAEWLLSHIILSTTDLIPEENTPARLLEEPAVFGGAAGAEVFVDILRRSIEPHDAWRYLGQGKRLLSRGKQLGLLGETALPPALEQQILQTLQRPLEPIRENHPALLVILFALTELGVLTQEGNSPSALPPPLLHEESRAIDQEALLAQLETRLRLAEEGDYFSILGVARSATQYEIELAWQRLHQELSSAQLSGNSAHLEPQLHALLTLIDEAHLVLSHDVRRARYRKALETQPPPGRGG